jgi:malate synthase
MSLYELLNKRLPRTSFDWNTFVTATVLEKISQEKAWEVATRIHNAIKQAQDYIKKAQDKKRRDVDPHKKPVDFEVKDKVFVLTKN